MTIMIIYVQHGNNLNQLQVSGTMFIGELYKYILDRLGISSRRVVCMLYEYKILGQDPLNFEKTIVHAGFYNNCIIYVIFNHFPDLTERYSQTTHSRFQQWANRDQYQLDDRYL